MPPRISETDLIINPDGSVYHLNLKPRHIADVVITVGDPGRVHRITKFFDKVEYEMNKREYITHVGTYKGKRITVISTGMGTDNVEILMHELDALVNIDLRKREPKSKKRKLCIIRIGTSGSIQEDIRLGTHVIGEYGVGMDPLMHFYDFEEDEIGKVVSTTLQEQIGLPFKPYTVRGSDLLIEHFKDIGVLGNTVTCHGFYAPQGRNMRIPSKYPRLLEVFNYFHHNGFWLTNMEMETAGYYALSKLLGHEMISANAIIANRIRNRFSKDPNRIVDALIKKVLEKIVTLDL